MQPERNVSYTYADYCTWPEDERWELIEGVPYALASPSRAHQKVLMEISRQIANYLVGKTCEVYPSDFDVILADDTVVVPDISVICDPKKLTDKGCVGAPDMIVEILSPGNAKHDKLRKFNLYLAAGVREFWIVDPREKSVDAYTLMDDHYAARLYGSEDEVPVTVLDSLSIDMKKVFPPSDDENAEENELEAGN